MKKILSVILALTMAATLLAGCGEKQGSSNDAEQNNDDKVLVLRTPTALQSTDWTQTTHLVDMEVTYGNVFEGLYGIDEGAGGYYPALAEDVQISDDQLVYTIKLRDAKFQNGDPLKASDVVFSYDRAMANPRFNFLTNMIDSYRAVDDQIFEITLKYPYSAILHTFFSIKVTSEREVTEAGDAFGTTVHKAATGPYYFSSYDVAGGYRLEAFDDYWGGAPDVKHVEYRLITEDSAAVIAFENGEIGYLHDAPVAEWESLAAKAGDNCVMLKGNNIRTFFINWESKNNNGILADENVRKAILHAINKDNINAAAVSGYGAVSPCEWIPSEYCETSPKASDGKFELYEFDTAKSHQYLLDAGFTEEEIAAGIPVGTIVTYGSQTSEKVKAAQVIQSNLRDVGLIAEVSFGDISVIVPELHRFNYDMLVYGDSGNYDYNNIRQMVASESNGDDNNGGGVSVVRFNGDGKGSSPFEWQKIDQLIEDGVSTTDVAERYDIYTELWSIVMDTAVMDPFLHLPVGIAYRADLDIGTPCPSYYRLFNFSWK